MALKSHYTMSEAATIAPIVLWSDQCSGNLYLSKKNTFFDFYTDENKAIKRSALPRSASADSHFKYSDEGTQSPASPTRRSDSPSNRSMWSSDNDAHQHHEECASPGSSTSTRASNSWVAEEDVTVSLGYPTQFMPGSMSTCIN